MNEIEMVPGSSTFPRRRVITVAVVLALALVVGSVAVLAARPKSGTGLPLLPAAAAAGPTSPAFGPTSNQLGAAQAAAAQMYPQPLTYRLQGTLPALAGHAPAYRLDAGVGEAAVAKLARALGLNAPVKSGPTGWTATDGTHRLEVAKDNAGQWSYRAYAGNLCAAVSAPPGLGAGSMMCVSGGSGFASASGTSGAAGPSTTATKEPAGTTTTVAGSASSGSQPSQGIPNQAPAAQGVPPVAGQTVPGQPVVPPAAIRACPLPSCPPGAKCPVPACPPGSGCGSSACPAPPVPPRSADLATPAQASQEARDLLTKAGIDVRGADVKVFPEPTADLVTVNPTVDGMPTVGMAYALSFGTKGVVQYANGILASPSKLGDYPLVGTAEGFKRLQAGRALLQGGIRTMMPMGAAGGGAPSAGSTAGAADLMPSRSVTVTAAHLALVRVFGADGQTYLEPAYVFETAAPSWTPPVAAVADKLLQIAPANNPGRSLPQPAAPAPGAVVPQTAGGGAPTPAGPVVTTVP